MSIQQFTLELKRQISQGQLKEVFETLGQVLMQASSELEHDVILLSNQFHQISAANRLGTISHDNFQISKNKLVGNLLFLLQDIESDQLVQAQFAQSLQETLKRNQVPPDQLLKETLKRHQQETQREAKKWQLTLHARPVLHISTFDPKPQGSFVQKEGKISMGRSPDNDITINDPYISRRHAEIIATDAGIWIMDLGSSNSTFLNQARIHHKNRLEPGELIIDQIVFQLSL